MTFNFKIGPKVASIRNPKNKYLRKAGFYLGRFEKAYYKSLHYEARARLEYMKYRKADDELSEISNIDTIGEIFKLVKTFLKMANYKFNSVYYEGLANSKFPERFWEPDNSHHFPHRYYKLPKAYTMPWQ